MLATIVVVIVVIVLIVAIFLGASIIFQVLTYFNFLKLCKVELIGKMSLKFEVTYLRTYQSISV